MRLDRISQAPWLHLFVRPSNCHGAHLGESTMGRAEQHLLLSPPDEWIVAWSEGNGPSHGLVQTEIRAKDEAMPTRKVILTAQHESSIDARRGAKLEALRKMAETGFTDLDQGRHCDLQDDELKDF